MLNNKNIIRLMASLLLTAFMFLFLHSELDLIKMADDECHDHDFCSLVDISDIAHHHQFQKINKSVIFFAIFVIQEIGSESLQTISSAYTNRIYNKSREKLPDKHFILYGSLLI